MHKEIKKTLKNHEKRITDLEKAFEDGDKPGKKITCVHCDYSWKTISTKRLVSCPNCGQKSPTDPKEIKKFKEESAKRVRDYIKKVEEKNKKYPTRFK